MEHIQAFCKQYGLYEGDDIQHVQLRHRFRLVEAFSIQEGMHVLEIGCGQGDTTVVLAQAVGESGHVTALDIAKGDYGAPFTLAQAHARIKQSPLGARIDFYLETDFLSFACERVDVIVLSHSSWYFASEEQLRQYIAHAKELGATLCFAEWDMAYTSITQRSHFCAASILALYSAFIDNDGNIQHIFSKARIRELAEQAGYRLAHEETVDASYLQDGSWERAYATSILDEFASTPPSIQTLVATYAHVMNEQPHTESLNSFVQIFQ